MDRLIIIRYTKADLISSYMINLKLLYSNDPNNLQISSKNHYLKIGKFSGHSKRQKSNRHQKL